MPRVAATYMKAAGYASGRYEGEPILMVGPVDGNGRAISELAKRAFESVGFKVKLRLLSQQVVMTRYCAFPKADGLGLPERRLDAVTSPTARRTWTRRSTASTSSRSATRTSPSSTTRASTPRSRRPRR